MPISKRALVFESEINSDDYKSQTIFDVFYKRKTPAITLLISLLLALALQILDLAQVVDLPVRIFMLLFIYSVAVLGFRMILGGIVKRIIEPDKICINNKHRYIVTHMGIHMTGGIEDADLMLPWRIITEAYEVQNSFYIYINMAQNIVFPKRYLGGEGADFMRKILQDELGERFSNRTHDKKGVNKNEKNNIH